jgi:hypothetical protein
VRERLRQIINRITARSVTVHRGRGQKLFQESQAPFWERYADHGGIRFAINEQHPLIASLAQDFRPRMWICFVSCWIRLPPPCRWR